ncbi:TfoX/Sxy family protein [Pseudomonas stutzeri]|uniref:TfoX/Sxy family protein n=1 Tax=Stutzerimonas stutzeri TaxID=316 RepID=UPI00210ED8DB|nr:TfoX/Sxy family protein [Stutzerimonas stutzeri]MCQ4313998.1 TfoX/Sxy family protein [Stutzerimonas stutzeri]
MHDELLTLKNLGKTSAQWLHASGIHTADDLRRLGSVSAYQAVKSRGFNASRVLLYAIEGALRDTNWKELPDTLKSELNQHLNSCHRGNKS